MAGRSGGRLAERHGGHGAATVERIRCDGWRWVGEAVEETGSSRRSTYLRKGGQVWIGLKVAQWDVLALEDDSGR